MSQLSKYTGTLALLNIDAISGRLGVTQQRTAYVSNGWVTNGVAPIQPSPPLFNDIATAVAWIMSQPDAPPNEIWTLNIAPGFYQPPPDPLLLRVNAERTGCTVEYLRSEVYRFLRHTVQRHAAVSIVECRASHLLRATGRREMPPLSPAKGSVTFATRLRDIVDQADIPSAMKDAIKNVAGGMLAAPVTVVDLPGGLNLQGSAGTFIGYELVMHSPAQVFGSTCTVDTLNFVAGGKLRYEADIDNRTVTCILFLNNVHCMDDMSRTTGVVLNTSYDDVVFMKNSVFIYGYFNVHHTDPHRIDGVAYFDVSGTDFIYTDHNFSVDHTTNFTLAKFYFNGCKTLISNLIVDGTLASAGLGCVVEFDGCSGTVPSARFKNCQWAVMNSTLSTGDTYVNGQVLNLRVSSLMMPTPNSVVDVAPGAIYAVDRDEDQLPISDASDRTVGSHTVSFDSIPNNRFPPLSYLFDNRRFIPVPIWPLATFGEVRVTGFTSTSIDYEIIGSEPTSLQFQYHASANLQ